MTSFQFEDVLKKNSFCQSIEKKMDPQSAKKINQQESLKQRKYRSGESFRRQRKERCIHPFGSILIHPSLPPQFPQLWRVDFFWGACLGSLPGCACLGCQPGTIPPRAILGPGCQIWDKSTAIHHCFQLLEKSIAIRLKGKTGRRKATFLHLGEVQRNQIDPLLQHRHRILHSTEVLDQ